MINTGKLKVFLRQHPLTSFFYRNLSHLYHIVTERIRINYYFWIKFYEVRTTHQLKNHFKKSDIALFISVAEHNVFSLNRLFASVFSQSYKDWQLHIFVDDHFDNSIFNNLVRNDKRVHIYKNDSGEIELDLVEQNCDWIMILTKYFILANHCLAELRYACSQSEDAVLLYTDHDYISYGNKRHRHNFKPDWNPDLFFTQEYIENCCIYKYSNFKKHITHSINQKLKHTSREWFYGFIISLSSIQKQTTIVHISKVLFHKIIELPPISANKIESILADNRNNKNVSVQNDENVGLKIDWSINQEPQLVSLIIPTRNGYDILKQAIDSIIAKTSYKEFEIIIVDNQSDCVKTLNYLAKLVDSYENIQVIKYDAEFNYSAINNFAVKYAKGNVLGFINNDIEVINKDWLTELVGHALRPEIGCVGAKLYYPNDTLQHGGVIVGLWGCAGHSHKDYRRDSSGYNNRLQSVQNYSAVTAACLVMRKELFSQVGGFDEVNLKVAFNDVDLCLKVQAAGYRNLWTPYAELYHHESVSRGKDVSPEQIKRANEEIEYMQKTWLTDAKIDPCYNPNLTNHREDFSLGHLILKK